MANPQKENGYTAIANELLDHIVRMKLNGSQFRVLYFIIRRTYGFNRKSAPMSLSFISNGIGIHRNSVYVALKQLEELKIISINHESATSTRIISVEKDYQKWLSTNPVINEYSDSTVNESVDSAVNEYSDSTVNESVDQKRNNINKNNKDKNKDKYCACAFFETLWAEYPCKKGKARVSKKSLEAINKIGYDEMHRALEQYKADKPDWQQWQNGSTFFNGGYLDYLDGAYEPEKQEDEDDGETNGGRYHWQR